MQRDSKRPPKRPARIPPRQYRDLQWQEFEERRMSDKLRAVYHCILDYCQEHGGNTPTIREVQQILDLSSSSVAAHYINRLIFAGKLEVCDRKLVVVGGTWIPPKDLYEPKETADQREVGPGD